MPLVPFMTNQFALRCSNTAFWNDFNIARDLMANFKVFRYNLIFYWLLVYFHWKQKIFMKWWLTFNLYSKKYFLSVSLLSYFFYTKFWYFHNWFFMAKLIPAWHIKTADTFQDFLIAEHMKPRMHMLKISISSQKHVIVRPTKTPKSADTKCQFLTFKVNFLCQKLSESF